MRYFENLYSDYQGGDVYINRDKIKSLIQHYVKSTLQTKNPCDGGDLYTGSAGIAFMFLKLYQSEELRKLFPSALQNAKSFIDHAKKFVSKKDSDKAMFLCGNAGIYSVSSVIHKELNNMNSSNEDKNEFLSGYEICQDLNYCRYGSDEVLFGRAGYLSGCYWMNKNLSQVIPKEVLMRICDITIESGVQYSQRKQLSIPLMWECYGDKYLGAAHGICAILHMLLESPLFEGNIQQLNQKQALIVTCIDIFLNMQASDGNFPCVYEDADKSEHKLVHWCHGAPGAIYLFAKAFVTLRSQKYLEACLKCGELIWQKGLLKKGPGICHGIAGNGYAFLLLYRLTNDQKHLHRAACFADFLTNEKFLSEARTPDRPLSLYEGVAGTICFLIDLLKPQNAQFPFMDVTF